MKQRLNLVLCLLIFVYMWVCISNAKWELISFLFIWNKCVTVHLGETKWSSTLCIIESGILPVSSWVGPSQLVNENSIYKYQLEMAILSITPTFGEDRTRGWQVHCQAGLHRLSQNTNWQTNRNLWIIHLCF